VAVLRTSSDHAQKKTGHAAEQDRPDVLSRRQAWFDTQLDLDLERLVFIDETGASTKMARRHGRAPRGQRLRMSVPHGHWKTTTFVGALRFTGMTAPMVLDRAMTAAWFLAYVEQILGPTLSSGDVLIEFGGRSTGLPAERMPIRCYAASELPDLTFPTAEPRVMRIERTFWEKATAVHVFCKADTLTAERLARHWYDLVRLDETGYAARALADRGIADQVAAHKSAFFAARGVDYATAVAGDLQLVPSGTLTDLLRADYEAMLTNGLLNDQAPSFAQLMERSQALQDRANAIGR
jgi:hypothetical protein